MQLLLLSHRNVKQILTYCAERLSPRIRCSLSKLVYNGIDFWKPKNQKKPKHLPMQKNASLRLAWLHSFSSFFWWLFLLFISVSPLKPHLLLYSGFTMDVLTINLSTTDITLKKLQPCGTCLSEKYILGQVQRRAVQGF